jgi:hypothetical protein
VHLPARIPADGEFAAFIDKLSRFRAGLSPREQHLFDTMLLAAGTLGPTAGGSAAAAPLD